MLLAMVTIAVCVAVVSAGIWAPLRDEARPSGDGGAADTGQARHREKSVPTRSSRREAAEYFKTQLAVEIGRTAAEPADFEFPRAQDSRRRFAAGGSVGAPDEITDDGSVDLERAQIREMFAQLPERDKRVMQMRFVDGLTTKEIADDIGVSAMTVSRLVSSSIRQLREQMVAVETFARVKSALPDIGAFGLHHVGPLPELDKLRGLGAVYTHHAGRSQAERSEGLSPMPPDPLVEPPQWLIVTPEDGSGPFLVPIGESDDAASEHEADDR